MKKLISASVCCAILLGLSVPAFATAEKDLALDVPSNVVLQAGEVWVPASVDAVMPREMEYSDCGITSHHAPSGYRYQGYTKGDSVVEGFVTGGIATIMGFIPGIGLLTTAIAAGISLDAFLTYLEEGKVRTTYYVYTWTKGSATWKHVVWIYPESSGDKFLACKVTT